ncbi:Queuosine precursor transporter [wastewater metagenome]|uniref:Queuosine transporter n=2 Tax=unclassified sequences TaxID=12908 RepID=A0A5B8R9U9_9ZZZZ|nr:MULTISPECIES: 7-cyano-7-deazaguanine/7-aminomethyl-7-deazaguanine transporter [Arhodomonas]MCS4503739.1 7-cyano-7-deazaguanine/7-aminomethyl-7-deazaguanine transporter [Arhodomonas aquaeolei]QEA04688.1 queuosine precursor transporter [uncultured organism]
MLSLTPAQLRRALAVLVTAHILIIAASNYLVQLPIQVWGVHTTWGAFSFPFIFLVTDLTVRVFGKGPARRIIFMAMLPALLVSYVFGAAFQQGQFQGLAGLVGLNVFVARIAMASFMSYVLGQILDIHVFDRLRQRRFAWWVAPASSTVLGNLADTVAFFSLAFYASPDPFMAAHWTEIAAVDYTTKLVVSLAFFVPLYGVVLAGLQRWVLGREARVRVAG